MIILLERGTLSVMDIQTAAFIIFWSTTFVSGAILFDRDQYNCSIYRRAPPMTTLLKIEAIDESNRQRMAYYISGDQPRFLIGEYSGILKTKIESSDVVGTEYRLAVVATVGGDVNMTYVTIRVVKYNSYAPKFSRKFVDIDLFRSTATGTLITQVKATDLDSPNEELRYSIHSEKPRAEHFHIDPYTGNITIIRTLPKPHKLIKLLVQVTDNGSPQLQDNVLILINIKDISEPGTPMVHNNTLTSAYICWARPGSGLVLNYYLEYWRYGWDSRKTNITVPESGDSITCYNISGLIPWKQYYTRVTGANHDDTSPSSELLAFLTAINGCLTSPCQNGVCLQIERHPGYNCSCSPGFHGTLCEYYNPCSQKPCRNNGQCKYDEPGEYECQCELGFYDKNCSSFNPCHLSPCQNNGTCLNTSTYAYQCLCTAGYYGEQCQHINPCFFHLCQNGAKCVNRSDNHKECVCTSGYYGNLCQHEHPCRGLFNPCTENGECIQLGSSNYRCRCSPGFYGPTCGSYNACITHPCKNGATCRHWARSLPKRGEKGLNTRGDCNEENCSTTASMEKREATTTTYSNYECVCAGGFEGDQCEKTVHCKADGTEHPFGSIHWPKTVHSSVTSSPCPLIVRSLANATARRTCTLGKDGNAVWDEADVSACQRRRGSQVGFRHATELKLFPEDPRHYTLQDLIRIAAILEKLLPFTYEDLELAQSMFDAVSGILDADAKALVEGDSEKQISERMLALIEDYLSNVRMKNGKQIDLESKNLVLQAIDIDQTTGRSLPARVEFKPTADDNELISLPKEVLSFVDPTGSTTNRLQFARFANSKFFISSRSRSNEEVLIKATLQKVIMASVKGRNVLNLVEPVAYTLPSVTASNTSCAYWIDYERRWSTENVVVQSQDGNYTTCHAYHLTCFAVLLDPDPTAALSEDHVIVMTYISYIGCGMSIAGLLLTLITYSMFKCLWSDKSGKILINLCLALIMLNTCYLLAAHKDLIVFTAACMIAAVFLHYFLLATMLWMCVEAINMYRLLVTVFKVYEERFLLKRSLIGWGIPAVIVAIAAAVDHQTYTTDNICMISNRNPYLYYISFMTPCCLILFVNIIIFILVTRVISRPPKNGSKLPRTLNGKHYQMTITIAQVRGSAAVMVLLGVTWVFGVFAFGRTRLVFQYIFCVTNSLQGFFIFLVRCLMFPEARSAWILLLTTGQFKKCKGSRKSASDNDCNSRSEASTSIPKKNSVTFANPPAKTASSANWNFMKGSKKPERNGPSYMPIVIKANPLYEMQKVNGHPPEHSNSKPRNLNNHSQSNNYDTLRPRKETVTYI